MVVAADRSMLSTVTPPIVIVPSEMAVNAEMSLMSRTADPRIRPSTDPRRSTAGLTEGECSSEGAAAVPDETPDCAGSPRTQAWPSSAPVTIPAGGRAPPSSESATRSSSRIQQGRPMRALAAPENGSRKSELRRTSTKRDPG